MKPSEPERRVTVVVVSDYEAGEEKTWNDERRALAALARQDLAEDFAVVLVENAAWRSSVPGDIADACGGVDLVFCEEHRSARMKDLGVRRVDTEYVAVMEADCVPNESWLRTLLRSLESDDRFAVASGRTVYGDGTTYRRCLTVLDRGFDDLGTAGETVHVSNNGALYRRAVLAAHPYPEAPTPFLSSRLRMDALREDGHRFWFAPAATMRHAIGGWGFLRDFRRNTGYADALEQGTDGIFDVLRQLGRRRRSEWRHCLRVGPRYLRWSDWPLLLVLFLLAPCLELPGAIDALRGRACIRGSAYR